MKRDYNLWITNLLTNEVQVIPDFSVLQYASNDVLTSGFLYVYLKPYLDNQIPFKVEFNYKKC